LSPGAHTTALRELFEQLLKHGETRRLIVERTAQVDTRYDMPGSDDAAGSHSLLGRWAPDLEFTTPEGKTRTSALMHRAHGVFLDLSEQPRLRETAAKWAGRIDVVTGRVDEAVPASAMLVRPDGYVAWATGADQSREQAESGLVRALTAWFGEPS
jgi:hypothetical protein